MEARHILKDAGVEAYSLEARLLVAKAAGKTGEELLRDLNMYVMPELEKKMMDILRRRAAGEPAAYLTGQWEFYGMPLKITKDVLIPRNDTEVLAEKAIDLLRLKNETTRVLDLCCGSGCLGIAIGANCGHCRVTMADKSPQAVRISRYNVNMNNLARNVNCIEVDALMPPPRLMGRYDLIVCNPPYIPSDVIETLDKSVKDFEPRMALDGGRDGLDFYRSVASSWKASLKDRGVMMFEVGYDQAESVKEIMNQNGFWNVCSIKDTQGIDRVVLGISLEEETVRKMGQET